DGNSGQVARPCERLRKTGANQQGAREPRPGRVRNCTYVAKRESRLFHNLLRQWQNPADVITGCQLRYDTTVFAMQGGLAVQGMGQQAFFRAYRGYAGFIAGTFKAKNYHDVQVYNC